MKTRLTIAILVAMAVANSAFAQTVDTAMSGGLNEPYGIAIDSSTTNNYFYITDSIGGRVVRFNPGNGEQKDITVGSVVFGSPQGIVLARGGLAVADYGAHRITFLDLDGNVTATVGTGVRGYVDTAGGTPQFDFPAGLAIDGGGNLYVADSKNARIRRIAPNNTVTTFGPATDYLGPEGVAVDDDGNVFVADTRNHIIRMISANGATVTTIAGEKGVPGSDNGSALGTHFNFPKGMLWIGGDTGLLVADTQNHTVRRLYKKGATWLVETYAGIPTVHGSQDGAAATATFFEPTGLAKDINGLILVVDLKNDAIRRVLRLQVTPPAFDYTGGLPALNFPGGSFSNAVTIRITNNEDIRPTNSVYRYTLDGSDPVSTSPIFDRSGVNSLVIEPTTSTNVIFKIRGTSPDALSGLLVSNTFNFFVNPLTLNVSGGSFTNDTQLTVSTLTTNATVRYTTDGSVPTASSTVWTDGAWGRTGPLMLRGFRTGFAPSTVISNTFTFTATTPVVNREDGEYFNAIGIVATTDTSGAEIRYTLDNTEPTSSSTLYVTGGFQLDSNLNLPGNRILRVKSFKTGYVASDEVRRTYTFNVAPLTTDVSGGSFTNNVSVNIATVTTGASLFYTTDGTTPTESSTPWVNGSYGTDGVLQVRGFRAGFNPSTVLSNRFNFTVSTPVVAIDVPSGTYTNDLDVTVTGGTTGAAYHYTLDGSAPTAASPTIPGGLLTISANARPTNSILTVVGIKSGYANSAPAQATYALTCDAPVISLAGGSFINNTNVTVTTRTTGATIRFTTDGTTPTASSGVWTDGSYGTHGTLQVRVFKAGYNSSSTANQAFTFTVDPPAIDVASGTFSETFDVTVTNATAGSVFYYTLDGTAPTAASSSITSGGTIAVTSNVRGANSILTILPAKTGYATAPTLSRTYVLKVGAPLVSVPGGSFVNDTNITVTVPATTNTTRLFTNPLSTAAAWTDGAYGVDGTLRVWATRAGFNDSDVSTNVFTFTVATPTLTPGGTNAINTLAVTAATATTGAQLRYTTDGSAPTSSSTTTSGALTVTTNATLRVAGFKANYKDSAAASADYVIRVDAPTMAPGSGYFPNGSMVTLSAVRSDATIRYTVNGVDPTASDTAYSAPFRLSQTALAQLRARAFAPNTVSSAVTAFVLVPGETNTIGIARDIMAGPGSSVVVPVVVNLKTNQALRSLQYRVEVWPTATTIPNLSSDLRVQGVSGNDFVTVVNSAEGTQGPATFSYATYSSSGGGITTNGLIITALGTNANFNVKNFATVALIVVPVPGGAAISDTYNMKVVQPSGTSDGLQDIVPLGAEAARTLLVTNIHYIVGDTSPGGWYNAGDFGDGDLDNADVNNAFYASLGVRVPYAYSDAFDSMDAYPDDTVSSVGGDGQIRFLDWQRILFRSLRRETNNWERFWSTTGVRVAVNATLGLSSPDDPVRAFASGLSAAVLQPHARLYGGVVSQLAPSSNARIPVRLRVAPGRALTGIQFRAIVEPLDDAPPVANAVAFESAAGLPSPLQLSGLPATQTTAAWSELINPLISAWQGDNLLGHVSFSVPADAPAGSRYQVRFVNADGAPNLDTQYDIETVQGVAAVQAVAQAPTKALPGVRLGWYGAAGQRYTVESATTINSPDWKTEAAGLTGQGRQQEYIDQTPGTQTKFYRVRLVQ